MVKLTATLCRVKFAKNARWAFKRKGIYKVNDSCHRIAQHLKDAGIEVLPATVLTQPPLPEYEVPDHVLPDFRFNPKPTPVEMRENYHEEPTYYLSSSCRFTEGLRQAGLLTNSQVIEGLPDDIQQLVGKHSIEDQDELVQRMIMQSQVWDSTKDLLPKRIDFENMSFKYRREYGIPDTRSASILLNNLYRISMGISKGCPDLLKQRRVIYKPTLEMYYKYKGSRVEVRSMNEILVHGKEFLPRLVDNKKITETKEYQYSMFPILPTIDLREKNIYKDEIKSAIKLDRSRPETNYPQLLMRILGNQRKPHLSQANNLMIMYGIAVAEARQRLKNGEEYSGQLKEPITLLNVNCTYNTFNFLCFQLNTLDIPDNHENRIKNIVWSDAGNILFEKKKCQPWKHPQRKYTPSEYFDYNPEVFKKFLAMCIYGYM